jgi:hypothetical protein
MQILQGSFLFWKQCSELKFAFVARKNLLVRWVILDKNSKA